MHTMSSSNQDDVEGDDDDEKNDDHMEEATVGEDREKTDAVAQMHEIDIANSAIVAAQGDFSANVVVVGCG